MKWLRWTPAMLLAALVAAWLIGGMVIFIGKLPSRSANVVPAAPSGPAISSGREAFDEMAQFVRWVSDWNHEWGKAFGAAVSRADRTGQSAKWKTLDEFLDGYPSEVSRKDFWGRPAYPWLENGYLVGVGSAGENGIWEEGENDDVVISFNRARDSHMQKQLDRQFKRVEERSYKANSSR